MKVHELIEALEKLPKHLEVVGPRYSDYSRVQAPEVRALVDRGGWFNSPQAWRGDSAASAKDVVILDTES